MTYLNRAISVWEGCGYPRGAALARTTLGEIALATGAPDEAVDCFTRAHCALMAVNDPTTPRGPSPSWDVPVSGRGVCARDGEDERGSGGLHRVRSGILAGTHPGDAG
ncbi:tetratricopeptide repeat protein [Streptomyces sp. M10(2022)]